MAITFYGQSGTGPTVESTEITWPLDHTGAAAGTDAFTLDVTGDTNLRFVVNHDGNLEWGPGNGVVDTNLYRSAADVLKTDDSLVVEGTISVDRAATILSSDADFRVISAVSGLGVNEGFAVGSSNTLFGYTAAGTLGIQFAGDSVIHRVGGNSLQTYGKWDILGECEINGDLNHDGTNVGLYGVAPVARAGAIATPTSDVLGTKVAIDAIRVALINIGITS